MSPAWLAVCAFCAAGALAARLVPTAAIDWQPALAATEPWRAVSAAFVHWSARHLAANVAGCIVVALFGAAVRVPPAAAVAWLAAWPMTQLGLLLRPELAHYGGLSGVLHAGVAVAATWLVFEDRARWIGAAVLGGLALKIVLEAPWGPVLREVPGWDIALAPLAHASGAVSGVLCALIAHSMQRRVLASPG